MTPVPQEIIGLIARFDANREAYQSGVYNETQLRREFIDPFFKALGWDVDNEKGYAEAYKDVIHEDSIKVGGLTKAPDYCFRVGGTRKFFIEAKKPSVNLKDDVSPAFQLRRYAWSAKLPLSILTDFEEFVVYDCRVKPVKTDKASFARVLYINHTEYVQRWDEIAQIFSRDAVLKGSFDKYAESGKTKKGTTEVDTAFLSEIESWRDVLARSLAIRNTNLTQKELNFAVQRTIDRIIFLRICEDRGIERYGRLMALLNGDGVYARLCELFRRADERYNSGLFHFQTEKGRSEQPDVVTPNLDVDDKPLKEIIRNLYYPDSPYEFSVLSADILGQVYEQFLGKVIRLTAGHRAVVEDKPEVKKAGGVYYTPTYIVDYIVKNTVGKLLKPEIQNPKLETQNTKSEIQNPKSKITKVSPKDISKIRILDPACGSGSFLLGAYQYLLDWHRDWYVANDPEKWATGRSPALYQVADCETRNTGYKTEIQNPNSQIRNWQLTTAERKRILLNNLYGVDVDPQAVEVTKLSLLLKVLEGESEQTIAKQLKLFHERALPDLGNNIKCGNSLIGTDFYTNTMPLIKSNPAQIERILNGVPANKSALATSEPEIEEECYRINPFDWEREFPEIMKVGGFDVVIGNPPYVRQEGLGGLKEYLQQKYTVYHGMADLYAYFIEKGVSLLREQGIFGYIVANKWMRANYGEPLRKWLKRQGIAQIVDFGDLPVFKQATTYPCILVIWKDNPPPAFIATQVKTLEFEGLEGYVKENSHPVKLSVIEDTGWSLADERSVALLNKLKKAGVPLQEYVKDKIYRGVLTGLNDAFVIDEETKNRLIFEDNKSKEIIRPFLLGRDIKRYQPPTGKQYLIFIPKGWTSATFGNVSDAWNCFQKKYPSVARHLLPFADDAKKRCDQGDYWWELRACEYYGEFEKPKLILPDISIRGNFVVDEEGKYYSVNTTYIIQSSDKYLLGILNSMLITYFYRNLSSTYRGGYLRFIYQYLVQIPIRTINCSGLKEKELHDSIVALVDQMLSLHKQLASAKTAHDKTVIQRQIDATDRQIDQLVYKLYGLTEDEIWIVEEGLP